MEEFVMAFCRKCGKQIDDDAAFCHFCGNRVVVTPVVENKSSPEKEPVVQPANDINDVIVKKKSSKAPLIISIIVIALAALFAVFWFVLKPMLFDKDKIAEKYLFNDGLLSAMTEENGQWGYINESGDYVIDPQFDAVTEFSGGYATVSVGGKWGIIDTKGTYIVSPQYDYISPFSQGVAVVIDFDVDDEGSDKYGLIDTSGKLLLPITYDEIGSDALEGLDLENKNEIFVIRSGDKYGYANIKGKVVIAPTYDDADSFSEGYAAVCNNDKYGFINEKGKLVISCQYDSAFDFIEDRSIVTVGDKYGVINTKGDYVVNPKYDMMFSYSEGYAAFKKGEKWGYVDTKGKEAISAQYDFSTTFNNGVAAASSSGKYGLIDATGKWVVPAKYYSMCYLDNGLYSVIDGKNWGIVNNEGKELLEPTYDNIDRSSYYDKRYAFSYGGKVGYLSENGEVCISNKFLAGSGFYSDGYAIATTDSKKLAVINTSGDIVNNKEYYGLAGETSGYCQYEDCLNTIQKYDSDILGITKSQNYCSQKNAETIARALKNDIEDMVASGETIPRDVPSKNLVLKIVNCSDMNSLDKINQSVANSCSDFNTKGYAVVAYVTDTEEVFVCWAHDKYADFSVGAYSTISGSLQDNFDGYSLTDIYNSLYSY